MTNPREETASHGIATRHRLRGVAAEKDDDRTIATDPTCNIPDFWKSQKSQKIETFVLMLMQTTKANKNSNIRHMLYVFPKLLEMKVQNMPLFLKP